MLRLLGALLLACAAGAWGMAFLGMCPARLGYALSLMCCGLAWALVPLWSRQRRWASRDAVPDVETPADVPATSIAKRETRRGHTPHASRQTSAVSQLSRATAAPSARDHAQRFSRDTLTPANVDTPVVKLLSAYLDWCRALGEEPCGTREIGTELAELFKRTGVEIVDVGGTRCVSHACIRPPRNGTVFGSSLGLGMSA